MCIVNCAYAPFPIQLAKSLPNDYLQLALGDPIASV